MILKDQVKCHKLFSLRFVIICVSLEVSESILSRFRASLPALQACANNINILVTRTVDCLLTKQKCYWHRPLCVCVCVCVCVCDES